MNQRFRNAERGQSLVELAIGSVVLVTLLSGLLDLGRLWYIYAALEDAAGEAALYLALDPLCLYPTDERHDGTPCGETRNGFFRAKYAVSGSATSSSDVINWDTVSIELEVNGITVDPSVPPLVSIGDEITVELQYPVRLLTPVVPPIAGVNPLILRTRATQRIIRVYR